MARKYTLKKRRVNQHKIPYADLLNPEQLQAVQYNEGPQLIAAGAGTGKTRTLIHKVSWLVEENISPSSIVLLTFTRRAAQEMKQRASKILDERCMAVSGGTFHSYANQLLRKFGGHIGLPTNFNILDSSENADVINLVRTQLKLHTRERRFPRKEAIQKLFSKSINTGKDLEDILSSDYPQYIDEKKALLLLQQELAFYKEKHSLLDYDDLLLKLRDLLKNPEAQQQIQNGINHLIIDEYQDTNPLQAEIALLLCPQKICVVGDDLQSIYSFRGATNTNILEFPQLFSECKTFLLQQNYRSQQNILHFCNKLTEQAQEKYDKLLFSNIPEQEKPGRIALTDIEEQADFVCQRILELREEGVALSNIAVLFRNAYHSNELEIQLNQSNLPFKKYGGIRFVESAHIKDVLAFLKVWFNPQDKISLQRILLLLEGLGPASAQKLMELDAPLGTWALDHFKKRKFYPSLVKLHNLFIDLRQKDLGFLPGLERIFNFYNPLMAQIFDDLPKRQRDLESLQDIAMQKASLEEFLSEMSLDPPVQTSEDDFDPDEYLTLSTIHSSKGLEFHSVFVLSAIEGSIPSPWIQDEKELEEELRLFYVACTRAETNLYLCIPGDFHQSALQAAGLFFPEPSRFIQGSSILEHCEDWDLEAE